MIALSIKAVTIKVASLILACLLSVTSYAAIDVYDFDSVQQEAQYRGLIEELRCPKCQNQNLAGSDAPIAQDLKQKTYDMVKDGRSDGEIRAYMQERYGDFISYKPPVRPSTWILWFFPPVLLVVVLIGWLVLVHRRQRQNATQQLSAVEQQRLQALLQSSAAPSADAGQSRVGPSDVGGAHDA